MVRTMRVRVDKEENALYFRLHESAIVESEEVRPGVILDFDKSGSVAFIGFDRWANNDIKISYVPNPLPPDIDLTMGLVRELSEADRSLSELAGVPGTGLDRRDVR